MKLTARSTAAASFLRFGLGFKSSDENASRVLTRQRTTVGARKESESEKQRAGSEKPGRKREDQVGERERGRI